MSIRVAIVGLGLGGAAAAAAMTRRSIDVTVFEKAPELKEIGAGITVWPNVMRLLAPLGLGDKLYEIGTHIISNTIRASDGSVLQHINYENDDGVRGLFMHRAEFLDCIAALIPRERIRLGANVVGVDQDDRKAEVILDSREREAFDVVVGADGIHSVVINAVTEASKPVYANLVAYRGLVPFILGDRLTHSAIWTDRKKYFIVYRVSSGRLLNFVGFVPSADPLGESWVMPGSKEQLAAEFAGWDPLVLDIIDSVETTFRWGLHYRNPLTSIVKGRVALMGDAAHPMTPHAGQGANQAIEDGFALAVLLQDATPENVQDRLKLYDDLRLPRATAAQEQTRRNGQFMHETFPLKLGEERPTAMADGRWIFNYNVVKAAEEVLVKSKA